MRAIAIKDGHDGLIVRSPDARDEDGKAVVFEMPDGATGTWFVEVDEDGKPVSPLPKKEKASKVIPGQGPVRGSQMTGSAKAKADQHAADVKAESLIA